MATKRRKKTRRPKGRNSGKPSSRQLKSLQKRFDRNPSDDDAFVGLWDALVQAEQWGQLAAVLEKRIAVTSAPEDRIRLLLRLGNLYDEKIGDLRQAVDAYQQVLTIQPKNQRALWSLAMLYQDLGEWDKVIEINLLQIELADTVEEKLVLRSQLARIYEERLEQDDKALMEYIRAARLAPENVRILLNMERLAQKTDRHLELLAVYRDVVEKVQRPDLKVALLLKLARLHAEQLGDEQAAERFMRRALELSSEDPRLLFSIAGIYGEEGEWEELIRTYGKLIELAESGELKSALRREMARLYDQGLGDPESAFFELVRVARYGADSPELIDLLCRAGRTAEKPHELAAVLQDIATRVERAELLVKIHLELARIHLYDLHSVDAAEQALEKALEIDPKNVQALLARCDILEAKHENESCAEVLERLVELPGIEPGTRRELLFRLARLAEQKLRQPERAVELYRRAMEEETRESEPSGELPVAAEEEFDDGPTQPMVGQSVATARAASDSAGSDGDDTDGEEVQGEVEDHIKTDVGPPPVPGGKARSEISLAAEKGSSDYRDEGNDSVQDDEITEVGERSLKKLPEQEPAGDAREEEARQDVEGGEDLPRQRQVASPNTGGQPAEPEPGQAQSAEAGAMEYGEEEDEHDVPVAEEPEGVSAAEASGEQRPSQLEQAVYEDEAPGGVRDEGPAVADEQRPDQRGADAIPEEAPEVEEATVPDIRPDSVEWLQDQARAHPADSAVWERLIEIAASKNGFEEAVRMVSEITEEVPLPEECVQVVFRRFSFLASSADDHVELGKLMMWLGYEQRAESSFRAALRTAPAHRQALDGLQTIFEKRRELERFDAVLTRALKQARDAASRMKLLERRARFRAEHLGAAREALEDLEGLFEAGRVTQDLLQLERALLERQGDWERLCRNIERQLDLAEPERRYELLIEFAKIQQERLDNPDSAAEALGRAIELEPARLEAYEALASLHEKRRQWIEAAEVLRRAVSEAPSDERVGELYWRLGNILEEQLLRPEEAEHAYRKAIDAPEPSLKAMNALRELYRYRQDWLELVRLGQRELELLERPRERAELLVEMASTWAERLNNEQQANECYLQAFREDPSNVAAARRVAELRLARRDHRGAIELLERLASDGELKGMEPEKLSGIYFRLATSAEAIGRPDKALQAFRRAVELTPDDHELLLHYGRHLARSGQWKELLDVNLRLLGDFSHLLEPDKIAELRTQAARACENMGKIEDALRLYREALKAVPGYVPALSAAIVLAERTGRLELAVSLLGTLCEYLQGERLARALEHMGQLLSGRMARHAEAADCYRRALEVRPDDEGLLEKLWKTLVKAEKNRQAIGVLEQLARLQKDDSKRAWYLRVAGDLASERLDEEELAMGFYRKALHYNPLDARAYKAAVKVLNRQRDWKALLELQQEMVRRMPPPIAGQEDRRIEILADLVELCRYRLRDDEKAARFCERLLELQPDDIKVREDLARLYENLGRIDKALELHRSLIRDSPFSIDSYHALRRMYERKADNDAALCVAATLQFLDEANQDELELLNQLGHRLALPLRGVLDEMQYQEFLVDGRTSGIVGQMFGYVAEFVRPLFVKDHADFHLRERDAVDLELDGSREIRLLREALEFFGLPAPEVYRKGGLVKGVLAVNTSPPALVISADSAVSSSVPEMKFMLARALAFTRPENLLAISLSPVQLRLLLYALVEIVRPGRIGPETGPGVVELAREVEKHLPKAKLSGLEKLADVFLQHQQQPSIKDWLEGVEQTCNRAGFVFCQNLEAAVQVLKAARVVGLTGSNRSQIRELIFYSISEDYLSLRRELLARGG